MIAFHPRKKPLFAVSRLMLAVSPCSEAFRSSGRFSSAVSLTIS